MRSKFSKIKKPLFANNNNTCITIKRKNLKHILINRNAIKCDNFGVFCTLCTDSAGNNSQGCTVGTAGGGGIFACPCPFTCQ